LQTDVKSCPVCGKHHRRDTWVFPTVMNRRCNELFMRRRERVADEPFGHRGHPLSNEKDRAAYIAERLGVLVERLEREGLTEKEAIAFIAGAAFEAAALTGETWHDAQGCIRTINGLLFEARAARTWSMDAIELAIGSIWEII